MRKILLAVIAIALIFLFCGCEEKTGDSPEPEAELLSSPNTEASPEPTDGTPAPDESESPEVSPSPSKEDAEAVEMFKSFLSENYDKLSEASFKSIAGIGFIDLDLDGCRELILFDAGASASMGVQIFDIVEGEVQCICANIQAIGEAFGGKNSSSVVINANYMEDFRLMEDKATGEKFFVVESINGNIDSSYSELIRFGNDNGMLTLTSVLYKYEEYDIGTGEVLLQKFRVGSIDAKLSGYTSAVDRFYSDNEDTGLECYGVFVWENSEYTENYKNFMDIVNKALELSVKNKVS